MTKSVLSWLARPYANPHATMCAKIDSDPHCMLSVFWKRQEVGELPHLNFITERNSNQNVEFVGELQERRNMRQCLRLDTTCLDFRHFCQITRSLQTLVTTCRLDEGSFLKISPFVASQILQRRVSRINSQRVASKWEGCVCGPYTLSQSYTTTNSLTFSFLVRVKGLTGDIGMDFRSLVY